MTDVSRQRAMVLFLTVAACALSLARGAAVTDRPLLALEKVISGPFVAGMNVTVAYTIHNVGAGVAKGVQLKDLSFPASRFLTDKATRANWPQLESGQSVSHHVRLEPKRAGELYVAPASVAYADGEQRHVTRLASDESFFVEDLVDFRRRTDKHGGSWLIYLASFLALGIVPFGASHMLITSLPNIGAAAKKS